MEDMVSSENPNWVFEYGLFEDISDPGGDLSSIDVPGAFWSSNSFPSTTGTTNLSMELDDSLGNLDGLKEPDSHKRVRPESCCVSSSKAGKEKIRREKLNDRFMELGSILDPERPLKDKTVILADTIRMVTQLRDEAKKLKDSNKSLLEKISELKVEKHELRGEKQRLKTEKEAIERQVRAFSSQQGFLRHHTTIPSPFSQPGQIVGGKMVPFVGYPGISMWQFMPPAAVDTSQDHTLHPPVA